MLYKSKILTKEKKLFKIWDFNRITLRRILLYLCAFILPSVKIPDFKSILLLSLALCKDREKSNTTKVTKKGVRPFSCALRMYERGLKKKPLKGKCMRKAHDCPPKGHHARAFFLALDLVLCTSMIVPLCPNALNALNGQCLCSYALNALNAPTGHKGIRASVTMVSRRGTTLQYRASPSFAAFFIIFFVKILDFKRRRRQNGCA